MSKLKQMAQESKAAAESELRQVIVAIEGKINEQRQLEARAQNLQEVIKQYEEALAEEEAATKG